MTINLRGLMTRPTDRSEPTREGDAARKPGRLKRAVVAAVAGAATTLPLGLTACDSLTLVPSPQSNTTPSASPTPSATVTPPTGNPTPTTTPTTTATPTAKPTPTPEKPPEFTPPTNVKLSHFKNVKLGKWKQVRPGIWTLSFRAQGQVGHVTMVDIRRPDLAFRTTRPGSERGLTVSQFAKKTGAVVAVNAGAWEVNGKPYDWSDFQPRGLAVSDGVHWKGTRDEARDMFIACDARDRCTMDTEGKARGSKVDSKWREVFPGWGDALVVNGKASNSFQDGHGDERHPRTSFGLTEEGVFIILVMEGRQNDARGTTYREDALTQKAFGAKFAEEVDGGGSSAKVQNGKRVNNLPAGQKYERGVAQVMGIVVKDSKK